MAPVVQEKIIKYVGTFLNHACGFVLLHDMLYVSMLLYSTSIDYRPGYWKVKPACDESKQSGGHDENYFLFESVDGRSWAANRSREERWKSLQKICAEKEEEEVECRIM